MPFAKTLTLDILLCAPNLNRSSLDENRMTVSTEVQTRIREAFSKGVSRKQVMRDLHLSKNTVIKYAGTRRPPLPPPRIDLAPTEICGEVVGIFAGDGSQFYEPKAGHYETNVHFGELHEGYAQYVKRLYDSFFCKNFRLRKEMPKGLRLRTHSKAIFDFFGNFISYVPSHKHDTVKIREENVTDEFKIGFLRGMIDTDGTIWYSLNKQRVRIVYYTTSKELALQISTYVSELNIEHRIYPYQHKNPKFKLIYRISLWQSGAYRFINKVKPFKAKSLGQ